jgi:hypothetical protein
MEAAHARFISAATFVEAYIVVMRRSGDEGAFRLKAMLIALALDVIDFTQSQAELAQDAFHRCGKGILPARLNMAIAFPTRLRKVLASHFCIRATILARPISCPPSFGAALRMSVSIDILSTVHQPSTLSCVSRKA